MTQARRRLGADGEAMAEAWYRAQGYDVLERNWRCRDGEIDLIVARNRLVVVCEVKTRSTAAFGAPAEAITRTKRHRLRHLAATWLDGDAPFRLKEIRFDVACILGGELEVIEGAF
jgi:putative endonuclease